MKCTPESFVETIIGVGKGGILPLLGQSWDHKPSFAVSIKLVQTEWNRAKLASLSL
ncbi:hypothetical protein B4065_0010 [Caldibacillus thermoamylovorans]|nr:hypothetical protein B4065_0010 [Caldibacillus thermoamylovorans]